MNKQLRERVSTAMRAAATACADRAARTIRTHAPALGFIACIGAASADLRAQHHDILQALNAARASARCAGVPAGSVPQQDAKSPASGPPGADVAPSTATPAGVPPVRPLEADSRLEAAAAQLARSVGDVGRPLNDLLAAQSYRAVKSMVIQIRGPGSGSALARFVEQHYCAQLSAPDWQDVGIHQQISPGSAQAQVHTWLVLAGRFSPPPPEASAAIGARVLELVNRARAQARVCGHQSVAASAPLLWNATLARASLLHAQDMATHSYFSHDGRDGSQPAGRATRAGYVWRATGENIAGGQTSAEAVVQGWIDSPPHCANLMGTQFTEMGVAYAVNLQSKLGIYWTQLFGTPR